MIYNRWRALRLWRVQLFSFCNEQCPPGKQSWGHALGDFQENLQMAEQFLYLHDKNSLSIYKQMLIWIRKCHNQPYPLYLITLWWCWRKRSYFNPSWKEKGRFCYLKHTKGQHMKSEVFRLGWRLQKIKKVKCEHLFSPKHQCQNSRLMP